MQRRKTLTKDRSITVRFSSEEAEALSTIASQYNMTMSDVIRCATAGELDKYLGRVKYVDPQQGKMINNNIITLGNVIMETRDHLRRIGVNLNQITRKVNAGDLSVLTTNGTLISKEELDVITRRVEQATDRAGEIVSCIVE